MSLAIAARCYINPAHDGWERPLTTPDRGTLYFGDRDDFDRIVRREWGDAARVLVCDSDTPRSDIAETLETGRPAGGMHPLPPGPMAPGLYVFVLVAANDA
jgi:hypothetical protein